MGALLALILGGGKGTKIATIVFTILLAASATFIGLKMLEIHNLNNQVTKLTKQVADLTLDNKILEQNNKVLKDNQLVLAKTSKTNYDTAKKLDEERATAKAAIAALAAGNQTDKEALAVLRHRIEIMSKDPTNDGTVAPVLRETIRQIQIQRDGK